MAMVLAYWDIRGVSRIGLVVIFWLNSSQLFKLLLMADGAQQPEPDSFLSTFLPRSVLKTAHNYVSMLKLMGLFEVLASRQNVA